MGTINDNLHINGKLSCNSFTLPNSSVKNASVDPLSPLDADKVQHQHQIQFSQNGTAADERRVLYVAFASGNLIQFQAGAVTPATGDSTVEFKLYKNGVSVLSATPDLDSSIAAYDSVVGGFSSTSYVAGDVFEIEVDATVGTGTLPADVFAALVVREAYA